MQYFWRDKPIQWEDKDKCPLCDATVVLKKQKQKEGCIKIRYLHCTVCEFDTRNMVF